MKTKYAMLAAALTITVSGMAQEVDDMYFNAKDRLALSESNQASQATRYAAYDQQAVRSNPVNPSDSYTGRGVNPEFSAQQKNGAELVQENPDYFLSSYKPKNVNSNLYSGNGSSTCNCNTGSAYSNMAYNGYGNYSPYGMYSPYGGMYSPYGGMYSPYGGMYSPYGYGSPYSSMGYGYGSGYGSMFSLSMGMGYGYGMGSMYGNPYGMYSPYGNSGYGYGYPVVVPGADPIHNTPGRRPVRASTVSTQPFVNTAATGYVTGTNGRTRSTGTGQNYYDPTWRNDPNNFPTRSYSYGGRSSGYSSGTSTGRSWGSNDSGRSRSFDSFGSSGSRSSAGSGFTGGSSSGGSTGRSRGRN